MWSTRWHAPPRAGEAFPRYPELLAAVIVLATVVLAQPARATTSAPSPVTDEIRCLALTIYFEARGEPDVGKRAVAHVVMNRVNDPRFPDSVCGVVRQGGEDQLHRCQFSWWCDGRSDDPTDAAAWKVSRALARRVFWAFSDDPTDGALWYHATYVKPGWRTKFVRGPRIGEHIFYQPPEADPAAAPQIAKN